MISLDCKELGQRYQSMARHALQLLRVPLKKKGTVSVCKMFAGSHFAITIVSIRPAQRLLILARHALQLVCALLLGRCALGAHSRHYCRHCSRPKRKLNSVNP